MTTLLASANITGYTISISPANVTTSNVGDQITVSVSVPFSKVSWLPFRYVMSSSLTLGGSAVMSSEHTS